jgi:short-subunit dehydrogenase
MPSRWRLAWITGASTGIGRELARQLATKGVRVAASARSADKLADLARSSALIASFPVDVTDTTAMRAAAKAIEEAHGPIDLAIFSAGTWAPSTADKLDAEAIARTSAVNYQGVVNGIDAVLARMIARSDGHIAIVGSVAGYRGLPRAAAYGPTKAALINLAETLACELPKHGVTVSLVNPGFVATPMTAVNKFPMPFIVPVERAAESIIRGLERRKFEIAFPWQLVAITKLARLLPYPLFFWLVRNVIARERR